MNEMPTEKEKGRGVVVRLLIFSGREDPEWSLEGEEAGELAARLEDVVGGESAHPPRPGGLGYRGFLLQGLRAVDLDTDALAVYHGVVSEGEGAKGRHWRDVAGLEAWLLSQARIQGHGQVLDEVGVKEST